VRLSKEDGLDLIFLILEWTKTDDSQDVLSIKKSILKIMHINMTNAECDYIVGSHLPGGEL
jgi:hypothetical protein